MLDGLTFEQKVALGTLALAIITGMVISPALKVLELRAGKGKKSKDIPVEVTTGITVHPDQVAQAGQLIKLIERLQDDIDERDDRITQLEAENASLRQQLAERPATA